MTEFDELADGMPTSIIAVIVTFSDAMLISRRLVEKGETETFKDAFAEALWRRAQRIQDRD